MACCLPSLYVTIMSLSEMFGHELFHWHVVELFFGILEESMGMATGPAYACILQWDEGYAAGAKQLQTGRF